MACDDIPVPESRSNRGPEWAQEWRAAHHAMAPYDRRPDMHLIDQLLDEPDRRWLVGRYAELADMTIAHGGFVQANGRTLWTKRLLDPTTMTLKRVGVVLEPDTHTILTAFTR
jgi:hypothetical protein